MIFQLSLSNAYGKYLSGLAMKRDFNQPETIAEFKETEVHKDSSQRLESTQGGRIMSISNLYSQ
ncbi:hypothetical protein H6G93_36775 [Nostoc sp. FACHB-973]|nr:hypothetical protein [Nostoc sp. FACHB-973]MBX9256846.1 hypothetical protein [Desmonostoc muscorum CCALA 125]